MASEQPPESVHPDYVKCIEETLSMSWCGAPIPYGHWAFQSVDHAIRAVRNRDRLMPCPDCIMAVQAALVTLVATWGKT